LRTLHFFAAATFIIVGPTAVQAGSILDRYISEARAKWHTGICRFNEDALSCRKNPTLMRPPKAPVHFETTSVRTGVPAKVEPTSVTGSMTNSSPVGAWIADDGARRIVIRQCGPALCGSIISANSSEPTDLRNPDAGQRNRSLVGLSVFADFISTEPNRWAGQLYNARDGRTYSTKIVLKAPNALSVEGEAPHSLMLQTTGDDGLLR
jgi:uncharacterized protein (DUF2147 family)